MSEPKSPNPVKVEGGAIVSTGPEKGLSGTDSPQSEAMDGGKSLPIAHSGDNSESKVVAHDANLASEDSSSDKKKPGFMLPSSAASGQLSLIHATGFPNFTVPYKSSWFRLEGVHGTEKRGLPEFFDKSSSLRTMDSYKRIRDTMIAVYVKAPEDYLSVTTCRTVIAFDVTSIVRIHTFLETWGIINLHANPATRPSSLAPGALDALREQLKKDTDAAIEEQAKQDAEAADRKED